MNYNKGHHDDIWGFVICQDLVKLLCDGGYPFKEVTNEDGKDYSLKPNVVGNGFIKHEDVTLDVLIKNCGDKFGKILRNKDGLYIVEDNYSHTHNHCGYVKHKETAVALFWLTLR